MLSSKVFTSGNSQAIRLPKEYQVKEKELYIKKVEVQLYFSQKMIHGMLLKEA